MTSPKFSSVMVNDKSEPLSLESLYRHWAAFAGITKTVTNTTMNGFDSSHWSAATDIAFPFGVCERSNNTVVTRRTIYDTDLPLNYEFTFTATEAAWAVRVRSDSTGDNCYIIKLNSSSPATIYIMSVASNVETMLIGKEVKNGRGINLPINVRIGVRDEQNSMVNTSRDIGISVWFNDELMLTCGDTTSAILPQRIGFDIVPGSANTVYKNLYMSALCELIPWSSLDPGEAPIAAIQRAIEDRYIKHWVRWDGSLYVYSPTSRSVAVTISEDHEYGLRHTYDRRQLFSHIRVIGAAQWVQLIDATLIGQIGHRFKETNNPSLWSTADCTRVGLTLFIRAKEQADRVDFTTTGLVMLEPEDRVTIPDDNSPGDTRDYIVDSLRWSTNPDNSFVLALSLRSYHYA